MRMRLFYPFIILIYSFVSSCSSDKDLPEPPLPPEVGTERTVLVYCISDNGNNDLSEYTISDFNEMVQGMASVDASSYNLLVYSETKYDLPHLIHISKSAGKVVADTIQTYEEQNPLDRKVMSTVISKVMSEFPADSYGLVLASHADGWMEANKNANDTRHFGDYRGYNINIPDLREVLENYPRFEFILFDACYMQSIEVAYELRNCTHYIIGSPTEIPGPGAPYQVVVPQLFIATDVGKNIARAYYDYYGNEDGTLKTDAKYIWNGRDLT